MPLKTSNDSGLKSHIKSDLNVDFAVRVEYSETGRKSFPEYFWEIILFSTGKAEILAGEKAQCVPAPVCFCLNQGESFSIKEGSAFVAVAFDPRIINPLFHPDFFLTEKQTPPDVASRLDFFWAECFVREIGENPKPIVLYPQSARFLEENFRMIQKELAAKSNPYWPCRTRSFLIEVLHHIAQIQHQPCQFPYKSNSDHPAEKVRLFLHAHFSVKMTLPELVREFGSNKTTLETQFTSLTGKSIFSYLRELRLSVAQNLLLETNLPVSEIAEKTGFSDTTHFARIFQKRYDELPSVFRKKNGAP